MKPLDEIISKLPPEYQQEVEDFVEFIFQKHILLIDLKCNKSPA